MNFISASSYVPALRTASLFLERLTRFLNSFVILEGAASGMVLLARGSVCTETIYLLQAVLSPIPSGPKHCLQPVAKKGEEMEKIEEVKAPTLFPYDQWRF